MDRQPDARRPLSGIGLISLILLSGCSRVQVDLTSYLARDAAFPQPEANRQLGVAVATPGGRPLLEAEVAEKVAQLLRERGYRVGSADAASYLLTCDFGIDAGREIARTVARHQPPVEYRTYYRRHGRTYRVETLAAPSRTSYHTERYTVYTKRLRLALLRLDAARQGVDEDALKGSVVWQCDAHCTGTSSDLRWLVNHLLIAGFDYFGTDTGRGVSVTLAWDDDRVRALAER